MSNANTPAMTAAATTVVITWWRWNQRMKASRRGYRGSIGFKATVSLGMGPPVEVCWCAARQAHRRAAYRCGRHLEQLTPPVKDPVG